MAMMHLPLFRGRQVFDRRSAVDFYRIFTAEHGVVNPDTSYCETGCDGSRVPKPCYTAPEAILCHNLSIGDHAPANVASSIVRLCEKDGCLSCLR